MSKKKKIIVLSCMVLLLAVTAVFNFVLSGKTNTDDDLVVSTAYFAEYKTERSQSRSEQLVQLNEIIASSDDSAAKDEALNLKLKLTGIIEDELLLETLIESRGYEDAVVSIGLTSDNINVIVKDADFTQDDAIVIYTILAEEVNANPENVTIVPIS